MPPLPLPLPCSLGLAETAADPARSGREWCPGCLAAACRALALRRRGRLLQLLRARHFKRATHAMRQLLRSRLPQHLAELMRCRRAGCLREAWAPAGACHSLLRRRWRSGRAQHLLKPEALCALHFLRVGQSGAASQLPRWVARLPKAPCKCVCPGAACGLPHVNGRVVRRGAFLLRPFARLPHVHAMQHLAAKTLLRDAFLPHFSMHVPCACVCWAVRRLCHRARCAAGCVAE